MSDPISEVIGLLQPRAVFSKRISGAGRWGVRYSAFGQPSFCAVLEGSCRLTVDGHRPLTLKAHDFVLLPEGGVANAPTAGAADALRKHRARLKQPDDFRDRVAHVWTITNILRTPQRPAPLMRFENTARG